MLGFLRSLSIEKYTKELNGKRLEYSNIMKTSYNNWKNKKNCSWLPFNSLKEQLEQSNYPLTSCHSRMFLEECMFLQPNDTIICLISSQHYFLSQKSIKSQWVNSISQAMSIDPYKTVKLSFCGG